MSQQICKLLIKPSHSALPCGVTVTLNLSWVVPDSHSRFGGCRKCLCCFMLQALSGSSFSLSVNEKHCVLWVYVTVNLNLTFSAVAAVLRNEWIYIIFTARAQSDEEKQNSFLHSEQQVMVITHPCKILEINLFPENNSILASRTCHPLLQKRLIRQTLDPVHSLCPPMFKTLSMHVIQLKTSLNKNKNTLCIAINKLNAYNWSWTIEVELFKRTMLVF